MKSVYIIAEAGVNHNGSLDLALKLVDAAAESGANAVKFQTFKATSLVSAHAHKAEYQARATGQDGTQLEMIRALELDEAAHRKLLARCSEKGIEFLSTPFDTGSMDFLISRLDLPKIKISSGDLTNAPLLLQVARTGKPVILSTGMASLADIESALGVLAFGYLGRKGSPTPKTFEDAFCSIEAQPILVSKVSLLQCTTEYPAPFDEVNLRALQTLRSAFGLSVGLSDHTVGIAIPVAAAALGAEIIEKHFTLDRTLAGPDHAASLEAAELCLMVESIRQVEKALGSPIKRRQPSEIKNSLAARRSLVAAEPIREGELFSEMNLTAKRPGKGIEPIYFWDYLGKTAARDYGPDEEIDR